MRDFIILFRLSILCLFTFIALCFIRIIDSNTFLLTQIFFLSFLLYLVMKFLAKFSFFVFAKESLMYSMLVFFFLIFILMNIDRSRSIIIYEQINRAKTSNITKVEEIAKLLNIRGEDYNSFQQRLLEQESLGGLTIKQGFVKETLIGKSIRLFSRLVARMAHLKGYRY